MMMQLACDCDANHKAAVVMDGLRDRLRLLVWGAFTNTYFLFDPCDPLIAFIQSPDAAQYPHQLPMTPHHSPASACHVLGVKGSPLSFLRMEPPHLLPRTQSIPWWTEMDWSHPWPHTFRRGPPTPAKSGCHYCIIEVMPGGVSRSSLPRLEGSRHNAAEGNSSLFKNNSNNVWPHVRQTDMWPRNVHFNAFFVKAHLKLSPCTFWA